MRCEPHTALDRLEALLEPHLGRYQRRAVGAMDVVREFAEERRADLLAEIEGGMPIWTKKPEPPFAMPAGGGKWQPSIWSAAKDGDVEALKLQGVGDPSCGSDHLLDGASELLDAHFMIGLGRHASTFESLLKAGAL